jgi:hypothetical protein
MPLSGHSTECPRRVPLCVDFHQSRSASFNCVFVLRGWMRLRMRRLFKSLAPALLLVVFPEFADSQGLQVLWVDPVQGPICAGPLGPGQCPLVAQWIMAHGGQLPGAPPPNSLPTVLPLPPNGMAPSLEGIASECRSFYKLGRRRASVRANDRTESAA